MKTFDRTLGTSKRTQGIVTRQNPEIDKNYRNPAYAKMTKEAMQSRQEADKKKQPTVKITRKKKQNAQKTT